MLKPFYLGAAVLLLSSVGCGGDRGPWKSINASDACKMSASSAAQSANGFVYAAHNDDYAIGALVSAKSLKPFTSQDIVVLLTGDVTQPVIQKLQNHGLRTVWIESESVPSSKLERYSYSMVKVCPFALTEYKKVVFVDSDTLVYGSLDNMFEKDLQTGEILGTTDAFLRLKDLNNDLVVTAFFMLIPDASTFANLVTFNNANPQDADMDLINNFFTREKKKIVNLPFYLNWQFDWVGIPPHWFNDVKVLHFNDPKPWNQHAKNMPVSSTNARFYADWRRIRDSL